MNNAEEGLNYDKSFSQQQVTTDNKVVVPVVEEQVTIDKKIIETARVRLSKSVQENIESFEIPLTEEEIIVKRVPKNEIVDTIPAATRYEGDVMIIPVLKEVAVIEKRIMLVEEIHVLKAKKERIETKEVLVRKEEVNVTRTEL